MLTHDDLIDAILEVLSPHFAGTPESARRKPLPAPPTALPKGRPFLSEHDIKRLLPAGTSQLRVPKDAIISPLALDWLAFRGVRIVRED